MRLQPQSLAASAKALLAALLGEVLNLLEK